MWKQIGGIVIVVMGGIYFLTSLPAQIADRAEAASWRHLALASTEQDDPKLAPQINRLGNEGWQLVDVANFVSNGETVKTVFYFKKPG